MQDIKQFIGRVSGLSADDKSMYRALRRFADADMVGFRTKPSKSGPELKIYHLTETGLKVLDSFVERNIVSVFFNKQVKELLK